MEATWYEIKVQGTLDEGWSDWFEDMEIRQVSCRETVIAGWVIDQSALHGLLAKIRNLNLPLLSIDRGVPSNLPGPEREVQGESEMADFDMKARQQTAESETGSRSRVCVVSYSHTGNNEALAAGLARTLGAERHRITEPRRRSMMRIILDMMFKRTPRINADLEGLGEFDLVVFVGPVWMGQVASPFRTCFAQLRGKVKKYAFITICGGADGNNPGLAGELERRLGLEPAAVIELHVADLMPSEPKPERKDTMVYRLNEEEADTITGAALEALARHVQVRREK